MDRQKELLEKRLAQHDENRKDVQGKIDKVYPRLIGGIDSLKEKISEEIDTDYKKRGDQTCKLNEKLEDEGDLSAFVKQAKEILSREWKYVIQPRESGVDFANSCELKISSVKVEKELDSDDTEYIKNELQEYLKKDHIVKDAAVDELTAICNTKLVKVKEFENRVNEQFGEVFKNEDERIQVTFNQINERINSKDPDEIKRLVRKAKLTLLINQRYEPIEVDSLDKFPIKVCREASLEFIDFEERKPKNLIPSFTKKGEFSLSSEFFDKDEIDLLEEFGLGMRVEAKVWEKSRGEDSSKTLTKEYTLRSNELVCLKDGFIASTTYCLKTRIHHKNLSTQWSDETEFTTPEFKDCSFWKECPDNVHIGRKYSVDAENPRIAANIGGDSCTIVGCTPLPLNRATSWGIRILNSKDNDGLGIYIGVAPFDIDQNLSHSFDKCGWYFDCYWSTLRSGPPHSYWNKGYGPEKEDGKYVHTGDVVGVVVDPMNGELSFTLNGVNLGVAYEGIPLDKPLVPCVLLGERGDSVELVI